MEAGLVLKWFEPIAELFMDETKKDIKMFTSIEDYVNEFTSNTASTIKFDNFRNALIGFTVIQSLILIVFVVTKNWSRIRNQVRIWFRNLLRIWYRNRLRKFFGNCFGNCFRIQFRLTFTKVSTRPT